MKLGLSIALPIIRPRKLKPNHTNVISHRLSDRLFLLEGVLAEQSCSEAGNLILAARVSCNEGHKFHTVVNYKVHSGL